LESPVLHFNNVKERCVGNDEYVYDSYVHNTNHNETPGEVYIMEVI